MTNKANIVGLAMVIHRSEVASNNPDQPTHLEVTVLHHDWSSKERCHKFFLVKYIIPTSKNYIKTHVLYVVGREVEISGSLVGFEMETHMAVVQVIDVSVTSGHHIGKQNPVASTSITKLAGDGRTIVKFSPNKTSGSPANPKIPKAKKNFSSPSPSSSKANGKRKANEPKLQETDEETDSESNQSQSDQSPDEAPPPAKKGRGRPRKAIIKDAARRLKDM
ncbi:hypothetical protein PtB15_8B299 [Puccinia triticina]|nr:hypothetical protein PtB15_8B299 [Puccinia triticina]